YRAEGHQESFIRINAERVKPLEQAIYTDGSALPGRSYSYYISAVRGESELFRSPTVKLSLAPKPVTLYQNFPNPFNPSTTLSFFIPERSAVRLDIYDTAGKKVKTLTEGVKEAGRYELEWNGRNSRNSEVSSGIYFYRLSAGRKVITRKLVLIR
ncbi:MAG: T9SS type A sorting domain-containing protein, partial [Candidatus Latescibacteria bacterium]|nr:T9SS type A sorting domain-containing protein [bacterium]MBD3424599.1 T9SS type A sorting domain-containing protein [Candidatus Latescibacterota bacterium]